MNNLPEKVIKTILLFSIKVFNTKQETWHYNRYLLYICKKFHFIIKEFLILICNKKESILSPSWQERNMQHYIPKIVSIYCSRNESYKHPEYITLFVSNNKNNNDAFSFNKEIIKKSKWYRYLLHNLEEKCWYSSFLLFIYKKEIKGNYDKENILPIKLNEQRQWKSLIYYKNGLRGIDIIYCFKNIFKTLLEENKSIWLLIDYNNGYVYNVKEEQQ